VQKFLRPKEIFSRLKLWRVETDFNARFYKCGARLSSKVRVAEKIKGRETMKKKLATLFVLLGIAFGFVLMTSSEANAQRRSQRSANRAAKANVDRIIKNLEERVDVFVSQFNDSLDNSRLNNTRREDNLNERARDLESATDELRREFDRRDTWQENKAEVRKCLNIASDIDVAMRNRRLGRATENNWRAVRNELNVLARAYNLPNVGGAYR
jgi:hypothetical protein